MPLLTNTSLALVMMAWVTLAPPSTAPPRTTEPPPAIDFADSLVTAQALVADRPRPIVVQFGASWCGWCRKLEAETLTDALVRTLAPQFAWVHVDVDADRELAARYGARALPHAVIIDSDGRVLAELRGFADATTYAAFLVRGEAAFAPPQQAPLTPGEVPARVQTLLETMAPASATGRGQAVEAIRRMGVASLPPLIERLSDERLAVRAAAAFTLSEIADAAIAFDPLGTKEARTAAIERWRAWVTTDKAKQLKPPSASRSTPAQPPAPRPGAESAPRSKSVALRRYGDAGDCVGIG